MNAETSLKIIPPAAMLQAVNTTPGVSAAIALLTKDRRSKATQRAYAGDLKGFFVWRGQDVNEAAVADLCSLDAGQLARVLNEFAADMKQRQLSEATVNRRLSAIRSLLKLTRRLGVGNPDPSGLVASEKVSTYRDTRGPGIADIRRLLAAPDRATDAGKRDFAILVLLWENGLRRAEVCTCDVKDYDAGELRLHIHGKGHGTQAAPVTLSARAVMAVNEYLATRSDVEPDTPLFVSRDRSAGPNSRLTGDGLYKLMRKYGLQALDRRVHPHAMRHAAITAVLDATQGDMRTAQRLSRHADIRTLQRYDDNREDLQGKATALLSALV